MGKQDLIKFAVGVLTVVVGLGVYKITDGLLNKAKVEPPAEA
jgi:hypothetical protein